jgi:Glycosyltransferases involved in cell wall biogenesis
MTSQEPQVWVVIAAYNEAPVIASVVADVKRAGYRALVVDDGSTDATGAVPLKQVVSWCDIPSI